VPSDRAARRVATLAALCAFGAAHSASLADPATAVEADWHREIEPGADRSPSGDAPRAPGAPGALGALSLPGALGARSSLRSPSSLSSLSSPSSPSPPAAVLPSTADDALARQLEDEGQAIDRAFATVGDKLSAADAARRERLAAALRVLHAAPDDSAVIVARRRAAARLLLERDASERALLVEEAGQLRAARARIVEEITQLPSLALPDQLARPAPGKIVRSFGTLVHERSRTTLSRRGIDIEVEGHSPVTAPAAGTVRYAGPIRGLDQAVILDHGSYFTVIAKLGEVAVPIGAPLAAGDRIGRAARHRVYLEVRVKLGPGGLPIDPEPLIGRAHPR
jgi:murein DD-endopeptidase MepM/ murein hydrolase activator NlpD